MHEGHRNRMIQKFMSEGSDAFHDHEMLEMLLYYSIPRKNTNETAHMLIEKFGSISGVFDAPINLLKKVDGVGETSARLIKLVSSIIRVYMEDRNNCLGKVITEDNVVDALMPKFIGRINEVMVLMLLDSKSKMVFCDVISEGSLTSSEIYTRDLIATCVQHNATAAIIAHNHPSGVALPSRDDLETTIKLIDAMQLVNVTLLDHYIFADGDCISIAQSGLGNNIFGNN